MEFRTSSLTFSFSLGVSASPCMLTSFSSHARKTSPVGRKHGCQRLQFSNPSSVYKFQGGPLIGPGQVQACLLSQPLQSEGCSCKSGWDRLSTRGQVCLMDMCVCVHAAYVNKRRGWERNLAGYFEQGQCCLSKGTCKRVTWSPQNSPGAYNLVWETRHKNNQNTTACTDSKAG